MSVDLGDLIDPLRRMVSPPGTDLFPNATDDEWVGYLSDAFWNVRMLGTSDTPGPLADWTESDGSVFPNSGTTEIPRELQQILVVFAAYNIVLSELKSYESLFRAKAGPVEFEVQKNGALLRDILAELKRQKDMIIATLLALGTVTDYYLDSIAERTAAIAEGRTGWVGH